MRFLKIYGGVLLILATVAILFFAFTGGIEKETYNNMLIGCALLIIVGILLLVFGGKSADKIGGK